MKAKYYFHLVGLAPNGDDTCDMYFYSLKDLRNFMKTNTSYLGHLVVIYKYNNNKSDTIYLKDWGQVLVDKKHLDKLKDR